MVDINSRISISKVGDHSLTEDEGNILVGTALLSYHSWLSVSYLPPLYLPPTLPLGSRDVLFLNCHVSVFLS